MNAISPRSGWRGYISPRPLQGSRTFQHIQNLVIRDHANRHRLLFKLSSTEYVMPGCYMMLEGLVMTTPEQVEALEDILDLVRAMAATGPVPPGRYRS